MSMQFKRPEKSVRPLSAKATSDYRHQKSMSSKTYKHEVSEQSRLQTKIDSVLLYRSNRTSAYGLGLQLGEEKLIQKLRPQKITKSKQTLYEENLHLKRLMNDMESEMKGVKTKMQKNRRRSLKYTAKLDLEFEKDIYWAGSSTGKYVVMGVKNQYDKVQQENIRMKKELDIAKRASKYTELQQKIIEIEACYAENKQLREQLDKLIRIYKIPENLYEANRNNSAAKDIMIEDLRKQVKKYESDILAYEQGLQSMNKMIRERDLKIEFLQKRIVEKQNNIFTLQTEAKRYQQESESCRAKTREVKDQQQSIQTKYIHKIEDLKALEQKRFDREILIFNNELSEKQTYIEKLEKQVGYLSALLKEIKPLTPHQPDPDISKSHKKQSSVQSLTKSHKHVPELQLPVQMKRSIFMAEDELQDSVAVPSIADPPPGQIKNRHYTMKRTKVRPEDIKDIGLEIKYRLLSKNVDAEEIKAKLVGKEQGVITIGELVEIFAEAPFCIQNEQKRILFARYLIQDPTQSPIYEDLSRKGDPTIVKSIFLQSIPKYTIFLPQQRQQIKSKVCQMLTKYHKTLTQVVTQSNRQQLVSSTKFIDLLSQQQLNMGEPYNDFMIMEMLQGSTDVNNLSFRKLLSLVLV